MQNDEMQELLDDLSQMAKNRVFKPFIESINFPTYRNFSPGLALNFQFPLTAVVGRNGTGKTSLLHALQGAPAGESPGNWWFGTPLDPIDNEAENPRRKNLPADQKAAFWYRYVDDLGQSREAIKLRVKRDGNPDYWEPSRPVKSHGMKGVERDPAIGIEAKYINFKTQISAFDRCFYFSADNQRLLGSVSRSARWKLQQEKLPKSRKRPPRVQDYLRMRAGKLRRALADGVAVGSRYPMHKQRAELTVEELETISKIIGRNYESGYILEHRFYEHWGTSVLFSTGSLKYSEAAAGSGESAVARLVHDVSRAKRGCLFLLDEPETSLHPGAQEQLITFLLNQSKKNRHQFVLSTHSPAIVRRLPREAIVLFDLDQHCRVTASQPVSAEEAFYILGHPPENKIRIYVEDRLAKERSIRVSCGFSRRALDC